MTRSGGAAWFDDLFSVRGKTVLVTGGSVGVGRMIVEGFVRAGASVHVVARKADALRQVVDELGGLGDCHALPGDLSTEDGVRAVADQLASRSDRLHVLIHNAGTIWSAPLESHPDAAWDKVWALNVKAAFHLVRFLMPQLEAASSEGDPARVVNIGSVDGLHVPPMDTYSYTASKAGLHHLTRHLAWRLAPRITVNAIAPGTFPSRMSAGYIEAGRDEIEAEIPLHRLGKPADICGATLFLCSDAGAYVTGAILPVDGGLAFVR